MSWIQADWLSTPTALTGFFARQEWEMGAVSSAAEAFNLPGLDFIFATLAGSTIALVVNDTLVPTLNSEFALLQATLLDWKYTAASINFSFDLDLKTQYLDVAALNLAAAQAKLNSVVASAVPALLYNSVLNSTQTWFPLLLSIDPIIILFELFFVGAFFLSFDKFVFGTAGKQLFYDDLVTLCKYNNLSLTEIAVTVTLSVGFIFFDIFVSFAEEDVVDALNYLILIFILLTFIFLLLATDIQYFYMVSNAGGDLTLRIVIFDLVNNILCALRVFFCWVRYIFYDLQVELVDLSFHYTDAVNETQLITWYQNSTTNAGLASVKNNLSLLSSASAVVWTIAAIFLDIALYLFQALAGLFKLVIASFLLWLIVDLFLLRGFALEESNNLHSLRATKKN